MSDIRPQDILDDDFIAKIEQLRLVSRKVIVGRIRGERITRKRGQSVEFADHRNYATGDDLRFLDWNLYARLDKLFLKMFLEEEDLYVYLLVDTSSSMGYGNPSKLHFARKIAAALSYMTLVNYDRAVLAAFGEDKLETLRPVRGKQQFMRVLQFLADLKPGGSTSLEPAFRQFALVNRRPGVVVVLSDFMDKGGFENALRYFLGGKQDVFLLHVLAQEEMDPALVGDLRLIDMEDADTTEVTISKPLLAAYHRTLESFVGDVKGYAGRRGMNYLLAPTSASFEVLVLDYLRRRGVIE